MEMMTLTKEQRELKLWLLRLRRLPELVSGSLRRLSGAL